MATDGWAGGLLLAEQGAFGWREALFGSPLLPVMLMVAVFYFFFARQDLKKQKDTQNFLANLKKNDAVVTVGGICGTVVNVAPGSRFVTIRVDDGNNTRLRILRSAIMALETADDAAEKESA